MLQAELQQKYPDPIPDDTKLLYYMEAAETFGQECRALEIDRNGLILSGARIAASNGELRYQIESLTREAADLRRKLAEARRDGERMREVLTELYDACVAHNVANGRLMLDRHAMDAARAAIDALQNEGKQR